MTDKEKVLTFLRDHNGEASKSQIIIDIFSSGRSQSELADLLASELAGLVTSRKFYNRKNKPQVWKLTPAGWSVANQMSAPEAQPTQGEPVSSDFARFKSLAKENPDASPQRLLQLAGRHIGDPLEDTEQWRAFRAENPEWYLQAPRTWYAQDTELDTDGYPLRIPADPLTAKERETRPTNERGWFDRAMRQPGASLEPLACEMPAFEVANVLRVTNKVGEQNALDIFGPTKIELARKLAGITQ